MSSLPVRAAKVLHTTLVLNYYTLAFQTLGWSSSIHAYASVYFIPNVTAVAIILLGVVFPSAGSSSSISKAGGGKAGGGKTTAAAAVATSSAAAAEGDAASSAAAARTKAE